MRFMHWADSTALDQLDDAAIIVSGVDLCAHLRGHVRSLGRLANETRFAEIVRQWLFAINVFLALKRRQGGKGVGMLGGADDDGIEIAVLEFIVELAEIVVLPGVRRLFGGAEQVTVINIAQGN